MSGGVSAAISTEQLSTENQEVNRAFAPVEHYTLKLNKAIKLKTLISMGFIELIQVVRVKYQLGEMRLQQIIISQGKKWGR